MAIQRVDARAAFDLVKARLTRLGQSPLDDYLWTRIEAAESQLLKIGVDLQPDDADDLLLVVDLAVWQYQNRDKPGAMPEWLRLRRRERWFRLGGAHT